MTTRTLAVIGGMLVVAALAQAPWGATGWGAGWGPGGMMGGRGMMGGWGTAGGATTPLRSLAEAEQAFQAALARLGNPDLALGEVMEFEFNFYAIVAEQSTGRDAVELLADRQTGAVFLEYGPAMMWNTTYGPMGGTGRGMMGGWSAPRGATVTAEQARALAQRWLDVNQPGSTTEAPDVFPGYYTLHITRSGAITGMLSVHAGTGQVWYHSWHGAFIASTEAGH